MLINKPRCNFKNCRYCFDGNCYSAYKYENCKVTDLHSEIAKLTVDLDNAKTEVAREIFEEIEKIAKTVGFPEALVNGMIVNHILDGLYIDSQDFAKLKKKYTEGET